MRFPNSSVRGTIGAALALAVLVGGSGLARASVLSVDFESYALGPLGAPWTVTTNTGGSTSTASIVGTTDHGKVLLLHGGTAAPSFLVASLGLSSSASTVTAQVDVKPAQGASFAWSFDGTGTTLGARRIRLQREPGSTTLVAQTSPSGSTACGPLPSGLWSRLTLVVHAQQLPHTFDARINGGATACTGVGSGLGPPFSGVDVMDASNDGWGGDVDFDNILVTAP